MKLDSNDPLGDFQATTGQFLNLDIIDESMYINDDLIRFRIDGIEDRNALSCLSGGEAHPQIGSSIFLEQISPGKEWFPFSSLDNFL